MNLGIRTKKASIFLVLSLLLFTLPTQSSKAVEKTRVSLLLTPIITTGDFTAREVTRIFEVLNGQLRRAGRMRENGVTVTPLLEKKTADQQCYRVTLTLKDPCNEVLIQANVDIWRRNKNTVPEVSSDMAQLLAGRILYNLSQRDKERNRSASK